MSIRRLTKWNLGVMRSFRKTKIVATLGPASSSHSVIKGLFEAGVNVFRLNFSHGTHETHKKNTYIIRKIEQEFDETVGIIMDLQGPKIRLGSFEDGQVILRNGSKFILDLQKDFGTSKRVTLPHPEIFQALSEGTQILLDDGKIELQVMANNGQSIETKVISGGMLSNKKGVNIPNVLLPIDSLTEKDINDINIARDIGADYIAVSFVQKSEDITYARKLLNNDIKIIAKIEKPKAIENLDSIIKATDAVMVARGDLGVEMPMEVVPSLQKMIVKKCIESKKPVIVATQMLESMIQNPIPTRAEVSDIANAVYQGADAVMLSAESASGQYPIESVKVMNKVISHTEKNLLASDERSDTLCNIMQCDGIKFIAAFTESGRTVLDITKQRLNSCVIALTPNLKTAREMCLVWGTYSSLIEDIYSFSQMVQVVQKHIPEICGVLPNENVVIVAGVPFRKSGKTNILHICQIQEAENDDH